MSKGVVGTTSAESAGWSRPVATLPISVWPGFKGAWDGGLDQLAGFPPVLTSAATRERDGRRTRLVLVTLVDRHGRSRPGITVHLLDHSGAVVDRTRTSRSGLAILSFPTTADPTPDPAQPVSGTVQVLDGTATGIKQAVSVPADEQFADLTVVVASLPNDPASLVDGAVPSTADSVIDNLWPPASGLGDDPLTRVPADFTPELYRALVRKLDLEGDSLLGGAATGDDFRARRAPTVTRLSVSRVAPRSDGQAGIDRYLVRMRQTWTFLGYTLGSLAEVESLDPGEILDQTVGTIESSVDQIQKLVQQASKLTTSSLQDTLGQQTSLNALVNVATSTETYALAGGFAFGIPGLFGVGGGGATAGVNTSATTSTDINTSLQVNHLLTTAQSVVNQALQTATSALSSLTRQVTSQLGRVSPLLSRVTNLLRWHVYENYAVCNEVEDIVELVPVKILDIPQTGNVFTDEDIVEYRRFFEPALLDPSLRPSFDGLARAVQRRLTGGAPVRRVEIEATYGATLATGHLTVDINGATTTLTLLPGGTRAKGTIFLDQPVSASALTSVNLALTATLSIGPDVIAQLANLFDGALAVSVTGISLWATGGYGDVPDAVLPLGNALQVHDTAGSVAATISCSVTPREVDTSVDPLVRHVNQNPSYYIGALARAALLYPSLRTDCPKLAGVPAEAWTLPIIDVEGDNLIIAKDVALSNPNVQQLLTDPGAATLVQLASAGVYSEALQGLLSLTDAEKLIHPKLLPPPAPVMPPIALVDLAGNSVVPIPLNGAGLPANGQTVTLPSGSGTGTGADGLLSTAGGNAPHG